MLALEPCDWAGFHRHPIRRCIRSCVLFLPASDYTERDTVILQQHSSAQSSTLHHSLEHRGSASAALGSEVYEALLNPPEDWRHDLNFAPGSSGEPHSRSGNSEVGDNAEDRSGGKE
jgi:hypothetical protein